MIKILKFLENFRLNRLGKLEFIKTQGNLFTTFKQIVIWN